MSVSNSLLFANWLAMESMRILTNKLEVCKFFNTEYNKEFKREFAIGETLRVKFPQRFRVRDGLTYSADSLIRRNTTVTVDQVFGIDFEWDSVEAALKLERKSYVREEYIVPAMSQLAQEIDSRAALFAYQNTPNIVGVNGTDPTALTTFKQARQRMVELACPPGGPKDKGMIISPAMNTSITDSVSGYFNPTSELSKAYQEGAIGTASGFMWHESMSLKRHTAGTWAGAVTINGAGQSGASLNLTCTTGDTFLKGDVISIASVIMVNPKTREAVRTQAKQFVITADVTGSASAATVAISPSIYGTTSQYQNVDALPANGAALTLMPGTTSPNGTVGTQALALHKNAFALVGVPLEVPKKAEIGVQRRDPNTGIAIRFVRDFDAEKSRMINRFDVLLGFGRLYNDECAVRIAGA